MSHPTSASPQSATRNPQFHRRGAILLVVLLILAAVASMTLVLCRNARVEAMASANHVASLQALTVERAAEQYVMALLTQFPDEVMILDESYSYQVPVGSAGYFWLIRPDYNDPSLPLFGLIDESSKININFEDNYDNVMPRFTVLPQEIADCIKDWRDDDSDLTNTGAEDDYYLTSPPIPYRCKNGPFETVEELLLVKGITPEMLYGTAATLGIITENNQRKGSFGGAVSPGADRIASLGLFEYFTAYSTDSDADGGDEGGNQNQNQTDQTTTQTVREGKINVATAPREVLLALPGLDENDVASLISQRSGTTIDRTTTDWVQEALSQKFNDVEEFITATSTVYSADILATSADGRAFRRFRIVVDIATSPPKIIYRREFTDRGWPLDPQILEALRQGQPLSPPMGSRSMSTAMR